MVQRSVVVKCCVVWCVVWCWRRAGAGRRMELYTTLEMLDARLEALDDLTNATHLVEFDLQLVDFAQDGAEAGDFGVGCLDGVAGAVVLELGHRLRLLGELSGVSAICLPTRRCIVNVQCPSTHCVPSLLDGVHDTVKVGAERL
jgi:hypothetical protein